MKNFEKHVTHFTVVSNDILRRREISDRARFLLICMLSLPDEWNFSIYGLREIFVDANKETISNYLKELQKFGYLRIEKIKDEHGRYCGTIYHIYEKPYTENNEDKPTESEESTPNTENPYMGENDKNEQNSPNTENWHTENQPQENKEYIKYLNNSKKISNSNITTNTNNSNNNDISNITELNTNDVIDIDDPPITSKRIAKTKDNSFGIDEINCVFDVLNLPKTEKREEVSFKEDKGGDKKFV